MKTVTLTDQELEALIFSAVVSFADHVRWRNEDKARGDLASADDAAATAHVLHNVVWKLKLAASEGK